MTTFLKRLIVKISKATRERFSQSEGGTPKDLFVLHVRCVHRYAHAPNWVTSWRPEPLLRK
jgi:hypothetical protein